MKNFLALILVFALAASASVRADDGAAGNDSIYQLTPTLVDQTGEKVPLGVYRGHPVLISMFYASCTSACPLLISEIQRVEGVLDPDTAKQVRILLVTFDPEHDKPAVLAATARAHGLDPQRWTLASTPAAQVRALAAVLGIKYRKLPGEGFNHSSVLVVLDGNGVIRARFEGLGAAPDAVARALRDAARATPSR